MIDDWKLCLLAHSKAYLIYTQLKSPILLTSQLCPLSIIKPALERCRFKLGPSSFELWYENRLCELSHLLVSIHWFLAQRVNKFSSLVWWTDRGKSYAQRIKSVRCRIKQISTRQGRHSIANLEGFPPQLKCLLPIGHSFGPMWTLSPGLYKEESKRKKRQQTGGWWEGLSQSVG